MSYVNFTLETDAVPLESVIGRIVDLARERGA